MSDFSVQFVIDRVAGTYALRLTDASSGTFGWGIFTVNYPQGIVHKNEDSSSPDISALSGSVDYPIEFDASNKVLKGTYTVQYTALINGVTEIETKTFDFSWIEPTMDIKDESDVTLPEVKFVDANSYSDGSYTNVAVRSFTCGFPSTSDLSANADISTTGVTLDMQVSAEYYEGVYNPVLQMTIDYDHITFSYLTVYWKKSHTEAITVKRMKTHFDLIDLVNTFKDNIDAYRGTNTVQFKKESQNYEQAISLYMHLLQRISLGRADGSQGILEQVLELVEPNSGSYTFQSGPISGSIATLLAGQIFTEGLTTNNIPLASGSEALADSNISQGSSDGIIDISTDLRIAGQLLSEVTEDTVSQLIQDATGISWTYDDSSGTLTPTLNVGAAGAELTANKGNANGYAGLDGSGLVPSAQLPSYIDDVVEYADLASFPVTGETGKIYVALDNGKTYRWSGSVYTEISASEVNSVFGRQGIVSAQSGDYTASQITNTPYLSVVATTVQAAINQLEDFINTINSTISGLTTGVSSVFGRSGAVSAQSGDYSASQITNTPYGSVGSTNVQAAINELEDEIDAIDFSGKADTSQGSWQTLSESGTNQSNYSVVNCYVRKNDQGELAFRGYVLVTDAAVPAVRHEVFTCPVGHRVTRIMVRNVPRTDNSSIPKSIEDVWDFTTDGKAYVTWGGSTAFATNDRYYFEGITQMD